MNRPETCIWWRTWNVSMSQKHKEPSFALVASIVPSGDQAQLRRMRVGDLSFVTRFASLLRSRISISSPAETEAR